MPHPAPIHRLLPTVLVLTLALAGATVSEHAAARNAGNETVQPAAPAAPQTARLDSVWQHPTRTAPAQVLARNESRLSAEVAGTVLRWTAEVGALVKKGDLLTELDPRDAELAVRRAEAAQQAAQARLQLGGVQLQRARDLQQQGFLSPDALALRETEVALQLAELDSAKAQLETARRQLAKTRVRAPFDGSVSQRLVQQGEAVAPGTPLYVLSQHRATELQAQVAPADAAGLRRASALQFVAQGDGAAVPVRLLRVSPTLQASNRSQLARLALATGEAPEPPPGTSGVLQWQDPAPHVPPQLIVRRAGRLGVFVQESDQARFVPLAGAQEGRAALVTLPPDTRIVVQGQASLRDGQPLR